LFARQCWRIVNLCAIIPNIIHITGTNSRNVDSHKHSSIGHKFEFITRIVIVIVVDVIAAT
jgi:hypothetical protein